MAAHTYHETPVYDAHALAVMLPPKLIGRDVLLAKVYSDLKNNDAVLVVGEAGLGKTALAATLASAYAELPGGALWLPVRGDTFPELLVRVARAYQLLDIANSDNPAASVAMIAATITQNKPLIVLDGEPNAEAAAEFVERCADSTPVLITSDVHIDGPWSMVPFAPLGPEHAKALFKQLADIHDDTAIAPLVTELNGSALAIAIAASSIKANQQAPDVFLASLPPPTTGASPALRILTAAFRALPNALQGLILMLGATYKGQGSGELLSMISGAPVEGVNQAMTMLVNRHLVERITRYGSPYYRLHPLIRNFAETWLRGSQRLAGLQNKVRDSVVAYASRYSSNADRLAAEMESFVATARWAASQNDLDTPNQLAVSLMQAGDFVNTRAFAFELMMIRQFAASSASKPFPAYSSPTVTLPRPDAVEPDEEFDEDIEEEDFEEEPFAEAYTDVDEELDEDEPFDDELDDEDEDLLHEQAIEEDLPIPPPPIDNVFEAGEMARLRTALMQARQQGDQRRQAEALKAIAELQAQDGMENEAISAYAEGLTLFEAVNDRGETLHVLKALAELENKTDNLEASVLHATRGALLADQLGELETQTHLLMLMGDARQQLGESEASIEAYEHALELVQAAGDARTEAVLLFKLGYAQLDNNDPQKASELWESALKMFKAQQQRSYEGRVLGALGTAYGEMDRWLEAINFHTSALYIAREVGDKKEEALQLTNLGFAAVKAEQLGQAVLRYRQALHLALERQDREDIVSTTVELANVLVQSPRHLLITELLVDEALKQDPTDRDLRRLKDRIMTDKADAQARGTAFIEIAGTAQDYAANAYVLLDEA
jgi:tetratricopeptide (TPR) repeat protein